MGTSIFPSNVTGVTVETATSGALSGDGSSGNKLAVGVDGTTIDVNGSNQLEVKAGGVIPAGWTWNASALTGVNGHVKARINIADATGAELYGSDVFGYVGSAGDLFKMIAVDANNGDDPPLIVLGDADYFGSALAYDPYNSEIHGGSISLGTAAHPFATATVSSEYSINNGSSTVSLDVNHLRFDPTSSAGAITVSTSSDTLNITAGQSVRVAAADGGAVASIGVTNGTTFSATANYFEMDRNDNATSIIYLWNSIDADTDFQAQWVNDLGGVSSTHTYYSWFDSRGVRRVKEDATFDSVKQAIEALYNPQFTKYTPGAVDYERVVLGQWNGNVAEIGTEKGGSGTQRPLKLLGSAVSTPAVFQAGGYKSSDGSTGASAGPFTVITAITVKNGLITSITGS